MPLGVRARRSSSRRALPDGADDVRCPRGRGPTSSISASSAEYRDARQSSSRLSMESAVASLWPELGLVGAQRKLRRWTAAVATILAL